MSVFVLDAMIQCSGIRKVSFLFAFVNSHAFGNGSIGEQVFVAFHYPPVSLRYVKHCRLPEPLGNEQCPVPWVSEGCLRSKIPDHWATVQTNKPTGYFSPTLV